MTHERKAWVETLTGISLLTGLALGGAAALYVYEVAVHGIARLTDAAVSGILDYFRGAEARIEQMIAEKKQIEEALDAQLGKVRADIDVLYAKLDEIRQASSDAAAEPVYDGRFDEPQKSIGAHGVYR